MKKQEIKCKQAIELKKEQDQHSFNPVPFINQTEVN